MSYTCIRPMRVQVSTGKSELRKPGDPVPEAANWPNPAIYIENGYIRADDHKTLQESGYSRSRLLPMRSSTEEDIKRGASAPAPVSGVPLFEGQEVDDSGLDSDGKSELLSLSRSDMNALASEHGVENAADYPNKGELADAILEAQGATV